MINSIQQFGENGVKRLADIFDSYTINPHPWVMGTTKQKKPPFSGYSYRFEP